ncbi:MAG: helix-turn-helix domain-containing protein [Promethearchaeota archaeon]
MLPPKLIQHVPIEALEKLYRNETLMKQARRYLAILECYRTNYYPNLRKIGSLLRVSPQTVGNWVRQWNELGVEGLTIKKPTGRPSTLSGEEVNEFISIIELNPREYGYNFSTWTLKKMKVFIKDKFNHSLDLSSISRILKQNDMVRIIPRPMPAKGDPKKKNNLNRTLVIF